MVLLVLSLLAASPEDPASLESEIRSAAAAAGGTVGVAILHVESARRVTIRGAERFPMASVFKLPVALEILHRVDEGTLRLDRVVRFSAADLSPGHSPLAERSPDGGEESVERLLEGMLLESDNTAADLLLPLAGGPGGVTARLRAAGIAGIRVDRSEAEMSWDYSGVSPIPPRSAWSLAAFRRLEDAVTPDRRREAAARFLADPRDTATPDALADLLARVERRDLLSVANAARLIDWMSRTRAGPARIKGRLPPGTDVAHRTGTCGDCEGVNACTNDAGIVTLPGRGGHLAIVVLVRASDRTLAERELAIARIARIAFDRWPR